MRVLIFGCSFSQGSYTLVSSIPNEECDYNVGWWSYVPCIENATKDIFAVGAGSYTTWVGLWEHYIKNKNYDLCLIQETSEPRNSIINVEEMLEQVAIYKPNDLTNVHISYAWHDSLLTTHPPGNDYIEQKYNGKWQMPRSWMLKWYNNKKWHWLQYKLCKKYLTSELEKAKIPMYFFHMLGHNGDTYGGIDLGLENVYRMIDKDHYSFPLPKESKKPYTQDDLRFYMPHPTIDGNKKIGSIVDTELKKYI